MFWSGSFDRDRLSNSCRVTLGQPHDALRLIMHVIRSTTSRFSFINWQQGNRAALSRLLTLAATGQGRAPWRPLSRPSRKVRARHCSDRRRRRRQEQPAGRADDDFAERGERVGVLACDPESPVTGGALLGDRCRIAGASASRSEFSSEAWPPSPGNRASHKTSS